MKKALFGAILGLLALSGWSFADIQTPNLKLTLPTLSPYDVWGQKLNNNFSIIDSSVGTVAVSVPVNVNQFGAKGDGTTDDTAAIQQAFNSISSGTTLSFGNATYVISSALSLPRHVSLIGTQAIAGFGYGTIIKQTNGSAHIFDMANAGATGVEYQDIRIENMSLQGGTTQLYAENGGAGVYIKDVTFGGSNSGITMNGFIQNWNLRDCDFVGGTGNGIYHHDVGLKPDHVTTGTPLLHDKCSYYSMNISGYDHAINIDLPSGGGGSNTFLDLSIDSTNKDAIVLGGALVNMMFIDLTTEQDGYTGTPATNPTTATTIATSPNVTVASGSGLVNGSTVTIAHAGVNGKDWYPVILSGGGTTSLVMTTNAPSSVTNQELVNYLYSEILTINEGSGSAPKDIQIIGMNPGSRFDSTSALRYTIDGSGMANGLFITGGVFALIYDPSDITLGFAPSNHFNLRQPTELGTSVASIADGGVTTQSYFGLGSSFDHTQFPTMTPAVAGQLYYCNDCAVPGCISTGTVQGSFGEISAKSTKCQ